MDGLASMSMKMQCLQSTIERPAIERAMPVAVQEAFPNYLWVIDKAEWSLLKAVHPEKRTKQYLLDMQPFEFFLFPFYNHTSFL